VSPTNIDKIHECDDRIIEENKSYPKCSINNNLLTYSGENELHDSVVSISNKAPVKTSPWIIPDVDSDDDFLKRQQNWSFEKPTSDLPHIILNSHRPFQKFSFPSDSEEDENPYSTAKSPSLSIVCFIPYLHTGTQPRSSTSPQSVFLENIISLKTILTNMHLILFSISETKHFHLIDSFGAIF